MQKLHSHMNLVVEPNHLMSSCSPPRVPQRYPCHRLPTIDALGPAGGATAKTVHFGTVEVRELPSTYGDHPCCSAGPAVDLSWESSAMLATWKKSLFDVDTYELVRRRRPQRLHIICCDHHALTEADERAACQQRLERIDKMLEQLETRVKDLANHNPPTPPSSPTRQTTSSPIGTIAKCA